MRDFVALFSALDRSTATRAKLDALTDYFGRASDADAAWALYFLAGSKPRQIVPVKTLRALACAEAQIPDWLFAECYESVGDLAETIALVLPTPPPASARAPETTQASLTYWIEERLLPLRGADESSVTAALRSAWQVLDHDSRFIWNKLITGGFRVGVSKLLITRAIAAHAGLDHKFIAERLMGQWQPTPERYRSLLASTGERTVPLGQPYPFFLAHALHDPVESLGPIDRWQVEWKWDGIRAQLVRRDGATYLWSRGDELITDRFPEIAAIGAALPEGTVLDGEVLAWRDGVLPFAILQQRIGRKTVSAKVLADAPAAFLAYDLLEARSMDLRDQPLATRRVQLEALVAEIAHTKLHCSELIAASAWPELTQARTESRRRGVEGLMLKAKQSRYGIGRTKPEDGAWWKWKIDPYSVDAVLVYAQRGHGRRASLYTDYTFAVWSGDELVPFAKAYSGLTDEEFRKIDAFIKKNTREKFGPVRSVTPELVFEIGFEGIARSPRHKSGVAVRFPRMLRIRSEKSARDADQLTTLIAMISAPVTPP